MIMHSSVQPSRQHANNMGRNRKILIMFVLYQNITRLSGTKKIIANSNGHLVVHILKHHAEEDGEQKVTMKPSTE